MTLSTGVELPSFLSSGYTNATTSLAALDSFKNVLADKLSLAHTDVASGHLYPATVGLQEVIGDPASQVRAPAGGAFPDFDLLTGIAQRGGTPMIHLEMTGTGWPGSWAGALGGWDPSVATWANWRDGVYDAFLDRWCTDAKHWAWTLPGQVTSQGNPISCAIILRISQEMNASWFPWRTTDTVAGGGTGKTNNTPAIFQAAFQHIHDRIRVVNGATHVQLLFNPWPSAGGGTPSTSITANFPGDTACQYVGPDAYSDVSAAGQTWTSVPSLRSKLNAAYTELTGLTSLPIIVGEAGVTRANTIDEPDTTFADSDRASWVSGTGWTGSGSAGGYSWVSTNDTQVRNITYFDVTQWLFDNTSWPLMTGEYATAANTFTARMPSVDPSTLRLPRGVFAF